MSLDVMRSVADVKRSGATPARARSRLGPTAVAARRPAGVHELTGAAAGRRLSHALHESAPHASERLASRLAGGTGPVRAACACGGTPGPSGECAECRAKRLAALAAGDVRAQGGGGTPAAPTAGTVTPQGCSTTQAASITSAVSDARTWMNDIEPKVTAFAGGTAAAPIATIVSGAISTNFHTSAPADISTIAAGFRALRTKLNGAVNFECASSFWCEPTWLAYVRGRFAWTRRLFDVNLCPLWFTCSNWIKRVGTIIHEISHQQPGADDRAYEHQATYATLSTANAIDNAESWAVTARQIYHSGAHGPGETC